MFSATKFVVAGVIVALFGGFLVAGVLTTQQQGDESVPAAGASASAPAVVEPSEPPEAAPQPGPVLTCVSSGGRPSSSMKRRSAPAPGSSPSPHRTR